MFHHTTAPTADSRSQPRTVRRRWASWRRLALRAARTGLSIAAPARIRAHLQRLRQAPDQGSETAEVVLCIFGAATAAFAVWKFLGPELMKIAHSTFSGM